MSYQTTNNQLVGDFVVKNHAINRFKERYPNKYIGNKKVKNLSRNKAARYVRKSIQRDVHYINVQEDGALFVKANFFKAIVIPQFKNIVVTII